MVTVAGDSVAECSFNINFIIRWSSNDQRLYHSKRFAHSVKLLYSLDRSASMHHLSKEVVQKIFDMMNPVEEILNF